MDSSGGRLQLTADQFDDRGFAGAGRTDEKAELAVLNLHGNAVERIVSLFVGFYHIVKLNHMYNLLFLTAPGAPESARM